MILKNCWKENRIGTGYSDTIPRCHYSSKMVMIQPGNSRSSKTTIVLLRAETAIRILRHTFPLKSNSIKWVYLKDQFEKKNEGWTSSIGLMYFDKIIHASYGKLRIRYFQKIYIESITYLKNMYMVHSCRRVNQYQFQEMNQKNDREKIKDQKKKARKSN